MQPSNFVPLSTSAIILLALALLLNSLGIYLLSEIKKRPTHQNFILINLSVVEIFSCIIGVIYFALLLGNDNIYISSVWFYQTIGHGTYLTYDFIMITITLDRLAMSVLSIRYQSVITYRKVVIILASCWIMGPSISLLLFLLQKYQLICFQLCQQIIFTAVDLSFVTVTVITYLHILYRLIKRRKLFQSEEPETSKQRNTKTNLNQGKDLSKFYMTSGLIILSYTLLVAIPNLIRELRFEPQNRSNNYLYAVRPINYIIDACVYILFQQSVRNLLKRKLRIKTWNVCASFKVN